MNHKNPFTSTNISSHSRARLPAYTQDTLNPNIPLALKASYNSSWSKLLCSGPKTIHLSPSPSHPNDTSTQSQTSFKVSLPRGYYGNIILDYASKITSPLARATPEGRRGYDIFLPGSSEAESLRRQSRKNRWVFALPVGFDGEVEMFEWRRSRGNEVKQLGASRRGWKLVRLGSSNREQYRSDEDDESLPSYSSEDGKGERADSAVASGAIGDDEVVAVWARTGCLTSLHDVGEFAFVGSGAGGELGQRFAVMAVMTALCIWQKAVRDEATAGAVTSVTSVAVVS
jgi:hypothetical protein